MKKLYTLIFAIINFCFLNLIHAQDGTLDSTFNGTGEQVLMPSTGHDNAYAIAVQPDSFMVVAGISTPLSTNGFDICVYRLRPDGTLDSTFATNGYFFYNHNNSSDYGYDVDLQPDGKIVVTGAVSVTAANTDFFAMRLMPDGTLDSAFATNGMAIIPISPKEDYAKEGLIQPDGKIVLAGYFYTPTNSNHNTAMVRLNYDGSLDSTFGTGGISIQSFGLQSVSMEGITLTPSGSYIGVGYWNSSTIYQAVALGINPDGSVDTTFGSNGWGYVQFPLTNYAKAIKEWNNNYYICGYGSTSGTIAAITSNGTLINSFGTTGNGCKYVSLNLGVNYNDLSIQLDGKIVAAGRTSIAQFDGDFLISRFETNGDLDSTFGVSGNTTISITPTSSENVLGMCIQPDGKILACGVGLLTTNNDMILVRLNATFLPTGINEMVSTESNVLVYPNPFSDFIKIEIPGNSKITSAELINLTGATIELAFTNTNEFSLPANLSNGMYILKVTSGSQTYFQKLVK